MSGRRALPQALSGRTDRCCQHQCEYRPDAVKHHLDVLLAMEAKGEDPCLRSPGPRYGHDSGSVSVDGAATLWDVQQAVKALRAEGRAVTEVSVAERLCPFALLD